MNPTKNDYRFTFHACKPLEVQAYGLEEAIIYALAHQHANGLNVQFVAGEYSDDDGLSYGPIEFPRTIYLRIP